MFPVEILPVQGTLVLRARGSELLILPQHVSELKKLKEPKDFTGYFMGSALINRPARKLFEAWLRKDVGLWKRIYHTIQKEMNEESADETVHESKPVAPAKASKPSAPAKETNKVVDVKATSHAAEDHDEADEESEPAGKAKKKLAVKKKSPAPKAAAKAAPEKVKKKAAAAPKATAKKASSGGAAKAAKPVAKKKAAKKASKG